MSLDGSSGSFSGVTDTGLVRQARSLQRILAFRVEAVALARGAEDSLGIEDVGVRRTPNVRLSGLNYDYRDSHCTPRGISLPSSGLFQFSSGLWRRPLRRAS